MHKVTLPFNPLFISKFMSQLQMLVFMNWGNLIESVYKMLKFFLMHKIPK
jgi:hypothetical protein